MGCVGTKSHQQSKSPFKTEVMLKQSPVKNQDNSQLCWAYAMLGTIELEHLMQGDSVNLSVDYIARMYLKQQAAEAFFAGGRKKVSLRGMAPMAIHLLQQYGITHYDAYHSNNINYNVLSNKINLAARISSSYTKMQQHTDDLLDGEIGYLPKKVMFLHAEYTFKEFAHSVCMPNEYLSLTSFTHHPYGKMFVLEVPDNKFRDSFLNLPLNTLMAHIKAALRSGHPVCWEGDISEPGFSFEKGIAMLPHAPMNITPQLRQKLFETLKTTDDHCMILVGLAHDKQGNTYFIAKNSWGTHNPYHGYMYLSESYVRLKTIAVYMKKNNS